MEPLGTEKSNKLFRQNKSHNRLGQKKMTQPLGTKKKSSKFLGQKTSHNHLGQKEITQAFGTKNHKTSPDQKK